MFEHLAKDYYHLDKTNGVVATRLNIVTIEWNRV